MVKSADSDGVVGSESLGSVAPFLKKCYEMVDDHSTDDIISWNNADDCFVIRDMTQFSLRLLPIYFKHKNFASFMRQLNIYGFRKIDSDSWIFAHDNFLRGKKHLLNSISRKKHAQAPEQKDESVAEKEANEVLVKAVESLKIDKNTLSQELVKLRQHHESSEHELVGLRERLQGMEKSQQQMLSFLVMAMQYPSYFVKVVHPKDNSWRVEAEPGTALEESSSPESDNGTIVRYHETPSPKHSSTCVEETRDVFSDSELMKFLMDDKIFSLESPGRFGLPNWTDDGSWEQLLLSSPFRESIERTTKVYDDNDDDGEENVPTDMDLDLASLGTMLGKS